MWNLLKVIKKTKQKPTYVTVLCDIFLKHTEPLVGTTLRYKMCAWVFPNECLGADPKTFYAVHKKLESKKQNLKLYNKTSYSGCSLSTYKQTAFYISLKLSYRRD